MTNIPLIRAFYESTHSKDASLIEEAKNRFVTYLTTYYTDLKPNGLLNVILKIEWKASEQLQRHKVAVTLAKHYVEHIFLQWKKHPENAKVYGESIRIAIADLYPTLRKLDPTLEEFIYVSTNTQGSSILFLSAQILFYSNELRNGVNRYDIDHITIPFLRSILESKIKQVLGIDIFRDARNRSVEISKILDILPELKSIELNKAFNTSMLKLIMEWMNHYMHRTLRPEPYVIHAVFEYLNPIFKPGERSRGGRRVLSINVSAFVDDIEIYHKEVEQKLKEKYPDCFISWVPKEVATLKVKAL